MNISQQFVTAHAHGWILETLFLNNEILRSLYLRDIFLFICVILNYT